MILDLNASLKTWQLRHLQRIQPGKQKRLLTRASFREAYSTLPAAREKCERKHVVAERARRAQPPRVFSRGWGRPAVLIYAGAGKYGILFVSKYPGEAARAAVPASAAGQGLKKTRDTMPTRVIIADDE